MREIIEDFIRQWEERGFITYITNDTTTIYRYTLYLTDSGEIVLEEETSCKEDGCIWTDPIIIETGIEAVFRLLKIATENIKRQEESYTEVKNILQRILEEISL